MNKIVPVKMVEMSDRSLAGSLGFKYGLSVSVALGRNYTEHLERRKKFFNLKSICQEKFGNEYQLHWKRKQPNRKWIVFSYSKSRMVICFKSEKARLLASMMY